MKRILLTCAFAAGIWASACANPFTFNTAPGATEPFSNTPVDAQATFTINGSQLTITLTDLLANPLTVAQNLSDLSFKVVTKDGTPLNTASLTSSSGVERTVAANGTFTDGNTVNTGWLLLHDLSGALRLEDLGGAGPKHTIIGPPNGSLYSGANNSITGNNAHNPFLAESATFVLDIPGMTVDTRITDVVFSFGTTLGDNVPGQAPDGGTTVLLLGAALTGFSLIRRRLA